MARPKKEKALAPADEKVMQLQYSAFMGMQNSISHALTVYRQMATNAMQATSQQLGAINAAMLQVQQATKKHMLDNNIDPETTDLTSFAPLNVVLGLDKNLIGNPLGDPLAVELQPAAVVAAASTAAKVPEGKLKKERKPRKPKDPNAPKRPLTGYLMYYTESKDDIEKRLKAELGGEVSKGRVQEEGKNVWNAMADKDKEFWKEKYKVEWEKYQEAVKAYLAKGGAIEAAALRNPEELNPTEQLAAVEDDADSDSDESSDDEAPAVQKAPTPPPAKKPAKGKKAGPTAGAKDADKKKKDAAKEATPKKSAPKKDAAESVKKAAAAAKTDTPDTAKKSKKRKSTAGGDDDAADKSDKKKKRKSSYGDDY